MNRILSALVFFFAFHAFLSSQTSYLHCGKLITSVDEQVLSNMTVIVDGNKITEIKKGLVPPPAGATLYDLRNMTVMPGWMDMHVHIEGESNPKSYEEKFRMNDADVALRATSYAYKTLMAGFTTVRDLGGSGVNVALRNAINQGYVTGPRIFTAEKALATTGGHADPTNGVNDELKGDPGPKEGVVNSVDDAWKAVRQRYKNGADLIKITATGGVLSVATSGDNPQFRMEELEAIIAAANDYGYTVAAHAHGKEGMKRAVIAGVTSIEHGTYMDDEVIELMKEHGTYYVPTIAAGKFVAEMAQKEGYYPRVVAMKAAVIGPQIQATFSKAYHAGVKIAFGTDTGVSFHGDNAREFVYLVEGGMKPIEAIRAATINAAHLIRKDDQLGTLESGKLADIVAVPGDPLNDVKLMLHVGFVMKDGKVYKNEIK